MFWCINHPAGIKPSAIDCELSDLLRDFSSSKRRIAVQKLRVGLVRGAARAIHAFQSRIHFGATPSGERLGVGLPNRGRYSFSRRFWVDLTDLLATF
jgi:hypothetical protein